MNKSFQGENDNYVYRSADELTIADQIASAKRALASVIRLSHINKSNYWEEKKAEIQIKIQRLESLNRTF